MKVNVNPELQGFADVWPVFPNKEEYKNTTVLESERIINNSLTWLVAFMFSDEAVLRPEFKTAEIISLKCDCGDETYETITFKRNDPMRVLKEKIRRIVMNGWTVANIELDGRLALNFSYLDKFLHELGPYGGSLAMKQSGFARFIPLADETYYFWDIVFNGEPL